MKTNTFLTIMFAFLFGVFAGMYLRETNPIPSDVSVISDTEIITDTVFYPEFIDVPTPYKVEVPQEIPININKDSCCIALFLVKFYSDTLINDSNLTAILKDTVFQNSLQGRFFEYRINRPTHIINNTTINNYKTSSWLIGLQANIPFTNDFRPGLMFSVDRQIKSNKIYSLSYDPFNKITGFGIKFKVK